VGRADERALKIYGLVDSPDKPAFTAEISKKQLLCTKR